MKAEPRLPCLPQLLCQHQSQWGCPQHWPCNPKGPGDTDTSHHQSIPWLSVLESGTSHMPDMPNMVCPRCHPIFNMFLRSWEAAEQRTAAVLLCPQTPGVNSTQCHPWSRNPAVTVVTAQTRSDKAAPVGKGKCLTTARVPDFSQSTGWPISHSQIVGTCPFFQQKLGTEDSPVCIWNPFQRGAGPLALSFNQVHRALGLPCSKGDTKTTKKMTGDVIYPQAIE